MKKIFPAFLILFQIFLPSVVSYLCQRFVIGRGYEFTSANFKIILINYLLWSAVFLFFISLFKKNYKSIFGFLIFSTIFILINRYKSKLLNQPVTINDVFLLKNLTLFLPDIIHQPNIKKELISSVIVFFISFFAIKKIFKIKNPSKLIRFTLFFFSIFVLTFSFNSSNRYKSILGKTNLVLDVSNPMNNCRQNGILFCFYDDLKNIKNPPPENYNQQTINQIYSDIKNNLPSSKEVSELNEEGGFKPNVIVILSEALWDATILSNIKLSQDPIKNIRPDIKSSLISPTYGGGTANVEFEILTGFSNFFLTGKMPYSQSIRQDFPSLFTLFKEQGYYTTAIHPFTGSSYNRPTVYKHFGLDKFIAIEDMTDYEKAGPFVSDKSFTTEILKQLNSTDQSQFIFALSMQNHFPFEGNRFPEHPITFSSDLDSKNHDSLQSYIDGINLSDKYYQILKEEIEKSNKPTIVIFYGDHLPLLGDNFEIYKKLNFIPNDQFDWTKNDFKKMYTTPIAIWSNFKTNLDLSKEISPSFLSLEILKLANITPKYQFVYLKSLESTDTILNQKIPTKLNPEQLKNYELIQYDLISGNQYLFKQ